MKSFEFIQILGVQSEKRILPHTTLSIENDQMIYLKKAFCGFCAAQRPVEMENLGRVICAILELNESEKLSVLGNIAKWTMALQAANSLDSFTSSFSSFFA